jgi:hypothetical protein
MAKVADRRQLDLLDWPALAGLRQDVLDARESLARAQRRLRLAPHGEVANRREALSQALALTLAAEAAWERAVERSFEETRH